jgi:hypothetical protein
MPRLRTNKPGLHVCQRWERPSLFDLRNLLEFRPVSPNQRSVTAREKKYMGSHYDYAKGAGNSALVAGRAGASFVVELRWSERPWPLADKYGDRPTDAELGLS